MKLCRYRSASNPWPTAGVLAGDEFDGLTSMRQEVLADAPLAEIASQLESAVPTNSVENRDVPKAGYSTAESSRASVNGVAAYCGRKGRAKQARTVSTDGAGGSEPPPSSRISTQAGGDQNHGRGARRPRRKRSQNGQSKRPSEKNIFHSMKDDIRLAVVVGSGLCHQWMQMAGTSLGLPDWQLACIERATATLFVVSLITLAVRIINGATSECSSKTLRIVRTLVRFREGLARACRAER